MLWGRLDRLAIVERLTPRDGQMYWLSQRIPSDQFLLFCFDGSDDAPDRLREFVARRCGSIDDLNLRIHEVPGRLDYPYWVRRAFGGDQFAEHDLPEQSWSGVVGALGELLGDPLDARRSPWRLHVFAGVRDAPHCDGTATVAVLQISHALADGAGASEIARRLFGREDVRSPSPLVHRIPGALLAVRGLAGLPWGVARTLRCGIDVLRLERRQDRSARPQDGFELTALNVPPDRARRVAMIVCSADELRPFGVSVTVAVLTAIGPALHRHLARRGEHPVQLGAEVTVALPGTEARNNFGNVGVDLHVDVEEPRARAAAIANSLAQRRQRLDDPLSVARGRVFEALPGYAAWRGVSGWDVDTRPERVTGNTVVSSVSRGPADLEFGGGRVRFTAGFPALSPAMALTHGVHGIGDTVTISLTASPAVLPDLDVYESMLREELHALST